MRYLVVAENFSYPLITFSTDNIRSCSVINFLLDLIANIPASVHTLLMSAPVAFGQSLAINSNLIYFSNAIVFANILNIYTLPSRSGNPNSIFLSTLPGLVKAGSNVSGLFVAINTFIVPLLSKPSS
jgi:hypothetical protein